MSLLAGMKCVVKVSDITLYSICSSVLSGVCIYSFI